MVKTSIMNLKNKSKKKFALFCFSVLLISLLSTNLITALINETDNQTSEIETFTPNTAWYNNTEAPISIDATGSNDWTWARTQPWCSKGDGSWSDPYVIENITIDSGSGFDDCIEIRNSHNAYFRIQNCTLFNGTSGAAQAGIHLVNTSKGLLIDNNCYYNYYGLYLEGSSNNTIQGNFAYYSTLYGIWVSSIHGDSSSKSYNNTLFYNRCYNNALGIRLNNANDIIITGNKCYNNSNTGITIDSNNFRAKIIGNECYNNTNNGLSIGNNCLNTTVQGNNFYYNEKGISLSLSYLITIEGNNCSFNTYGIFLAGSDNNTIKENIVTNNKYNGISLADEYITFSIYSQNNKLSGNDCTYNNYGIFSHGGGNHNITGNNCDNNRYYGIIIQSNSLDNKILGNNCSFNGYNGILASSGSHRTDAIGNNCSYNDEHGMKVMDSNDFAISNNIMNHNGKTITSFCGLYTDNSNNTNINGNTFNDNIYAGVWIKGDSNNLTGNTCNDNYNGIMLQGSNNNASLNTCRSNVFGIHISSGTENEVAWNALLGNTNCILDTGTGTNIHDNFCAYAPGFFVLTSDSGYPDSDGSFNLTWESASEADNYSVYVYSSIITEINSSLGTPVASEITALTLSLTGYSNGRYYFIIVAHNDYGDTLSDCIVVWVDDTPVEPEIPGYPVYLLLSFFTVITAILIMKKRRKLSKF